MGRTGSWYSDANAVAVVMLLAIGSPTMSSAEPARDGADSPPQPTRSSDSARSDFYDIARLDLGRLTELAPQPMHETPLIEFDGNFVDRSEIANVLRELRGLELVRLWQSNSARLYIGVGPNGLAGINFTQLRVVVKRRSTPPPPDYAAQIAALLEQTD